MKRCCGVAVALALLAFATVAADAQTIDPTHRVNVYATGGKSNTNRHGQAEIESVHFEWGKALSARTELVFVAAPHVITQPISSFGEGVEGEERVRAISGSLMLRRRFMINSSLVQPYLELGSGPMWATRRVPASTSRFNFISQTGFGAVLFPKRASAFFVGYRFAHISNAGYAPRNPGLNVSSLLIGVQVVPMRSR
jgi:hypothetical protein